MSRAASVTGIVVLNWNNARDTTACLSSLRSLDDEGHVVYVVDNGSAPGGGSWS